MNENDQQPGPGPSDPDVGSVAQEAAQLFAALGGWARQQGGEHAGAAAGAARAAEDAARSVGEHIATGGEDCRYCPLCQAISLARATSPEVKAHLLVAANALVQAASAALATRPPHQSPGPPVQKIDLEDPADPGTTDWNEAP